MRTLRHLLWFALIAGTCLAQPRAVLPFNSDWRFYKGDVEGASAADFADAAWQKVALPHTYNAWDALPGNAMYQGPAWYRKGFAAYPEWKGRRVFVRFEAASLVADVYLNGTRLGSHQGGFAAFCFELTPHLRLGAQNTLAVRVDNKRGEISPLGGDFTIYGGLYCQDLGGQDLGGQDLGDQSLGVAIDPPAFHACINRRRNGATTSRSGAGGRHSRFPRVR